MTISGNGRDRPLPEYYIIFHQQICKYTINLEIRCISIIFLTFNNENRNSIVASRNNKVISDFVPNFDSIKKRKKKKRGKVCFVCSSN